MSGGVELKVVLVGGDEQEQAILNGQTPPPMPGAAGADATGQAVIDSMDKLSQYIDQLVTRQHDEPTPRREPRREPEGGALQAPRQTATAQDSRADMSGIERLLSRVLPSRMMDLFSNLSGMGRAASSTASAATSINSAANVAKMAGDAHHGLRGVGTATVAGTEAAAVARTLATAGPYLAAAAAAALAVKVQFDMLERAVSTATGKLREFSPDIQMVDAQTEARRSQVSIRRAQELGPSLASIQAGRDRLADAIDRLGWAVFIPILKLVEKGVPLLEAIAAVADQTTEGIEAIVSAINLLAVPLTGQDATKALDDFKKELKEFLQPGSKQPDMMGGPDELMRSIMNGGLGGGPVPRNPPPQLGGFP